MGLINVIRRYLPLILVVVGIIIVTYFLLIRPWSLRLGVKSKELDIPLTGDGLVSTPGMEYMQAITINAPAEIVWKYLIQVGYQRAGWYNLDFINRLSGKDYFYENNKSADRVIPELQNLKVGDKIYLNPQLCLDVNTLTDNKDMLLTVNEGDKYQVSWIFSLKEVEPDKTRFYVRWRSDLGNSFMLNLMNILFIEPGSAIQQSAMLRGIKSRAEKDYESSL